MKTSARFLQAPPAAHARAVAVTLPADEAAPGEAQGGNSLLRGLLDLALLPVLLAINLAWLASDALCFRAARRKGAGRAGR